MINEWNQFLAEKGFEKFCQRDFVRTSRPVSRLIGEIPAGVGERRVRVNAAIEIHDPFAEHRDYHVNDLRGDVTSERIVVHYEPQPHWLNPDEKDAVFGLLVCCLDSWFDYWCDINNLIKYFEMPVDMVATVPSEHRFGAVHILGKPVKPRRIPRWDYLLSLLHFHAGNRDKSLDYARKYLEFVRSASLPEEPERTISQIAALS